MTTIKNTLQQGIWRKISDSIKQDSFNLKSFTIIQVRIVLFLNEWAMFLSKLFKNSTTYQFHYINLNFSGWNQMKVLKEHDYGKNKPKGIRELPR